VGPFSLEPTPEYLFDWSSAVREIEADGIELYLKSIYRCLQSDSPTIPSLYHGFREFKKNKQQDSGAKSIHNRVQSTTFGDKEFLVINFMDAHTPYFPPKDYSSFREPVNVTIGDGFAKANINQSRIKKAYDESVKYLSDIYYDVFNDLRSDFDYIITLSDHGELLGEHGMWNHGYGLYPELAHIPLTIFGDGFDGIEDSPVSILDVHKTIGELTNVSVDSRGQSLNTTKFEPQPRLTEYHGFLPGHEEQFERKKISREIFDIHDIILRGVVDSEARYGYETPEGFIGAQHLEKLLEELIEELSIKNIDESDEVELSDEIKDHLKDLGYA
jgi:arylsulfatase